MTRPADDSGDGTGADRFDAPLYLARYRQRAGSDNGDGSTTTAGDRSEDYKLLPVSVRVTWTDTEGIHEMQVVRLLTRRKP